MSKFYSLKRKDNENLSVAVLVMPLGGYRPARDDLTGLTSSEPK